MCHRHDVSSNTISKTSDCLHYDLEVVSHDFCYQKPFYTLYYQEASTRDRDVNALGNAHPDDKGKAEADPLLCFPCLETDGPVKGGKWWVISRCELVGWVASYSGTTVLPFSRADNSSDRVGSTKGTVIVYKSCFCFSLNTWLFSVVIYRKVLQEV